MINILLVDDHKIVRSGIHYIIDATPGLRVVAEAANGEDAVKFAKEHQPDVILMDLQMPGIGGLEATRKIVRQNPKIKILVLTVCDDDVFSVRLLKSGALGYLTKGCEAEELLKAIKEVANGQRYLSPELAQQLALKRFDGDEEASPFEELSGRELQVMLMITKGQKVLEIAEKLHLSTKTINTYRYRLFTKLGVKNDVELTHLAMRYDLVEKGRSL